jgi:predicted signal transduction protein with EAL and GGDEF domain
MTSGHMFLVSHPRVGRPLHVTYVVAGADRQACQDLLVSGLCEPEIDVHYARPLTSDELAKLGVSAGDFRSVWPTLEL